MRLRLVYCVMLACCVAASLFAGSRLPSVSSVQAEEKPAAETPSTSFANVEPVERSTHELMEYVFEEPYKRLKANLPGETHDKAFFRALKSDSLILAEAGNMLLMRLPKEDADAWTELSLAVRGEATDLYNAGKAKDVPAARKLFSSLVKKCNACHDQFAEGEHQLSP